MTSRCRCHSGPNPNSRHNCSSLTPKLSLSSITNSSFECLASPSPNTYQEMAMRRSARKTTKSEPSPAGQKRDRSDYVSDLPAEKPPVVNNSQPISRALIDKVDRGVTTEINEDDSDNTPPYVYDPPWRKDLVRDETYYFALVTIQVSYNCATAAK